MHKFPNLDTWGWAGEAEKIKCGCRVSTQLSLVNGFWNSLNASAFRVEWPSLASTAARL